MNYFYRENPVLEAQIDAFFARLSAENEEKYDGALSIILLGSLSRGEATWMQEADGTWKLLSDIEFFTVYPEGFTRFADFTQTIKETADAVFGNSKTSFFHVDNSYVCLSSLPRMDKKLLTYDAKAYGKCVVGKDVMTALPQVDIYNINLHDIHDVLVHRVFSVLYYGFPYKAQGKETEYRYSLAKNSLDLMTVILVNNGQLASGFVNRLALIEKLDIDSRVKEYFSFCLSIKLSTDSPYNFSIEEMEEMFISLVKQADKAFTYRFRNLRNNVKTVTRRRMGVLKRAIKKKHPAISQKRHLHRLIALFESGKGLSSRTLKDNLVLNGYPV